MVIASKEISGKRHSHEVGSHRPERARPASSDLRQQPRRGRRPRARRPGVPVRHLVAANPTVFHIDGIETPASTVTALHGLGDKAICYIEIGSAGNYYAASGEGIPVSYYAQLKAAGDLGAKMAGYPEYYLKINSPSTVSIIESMIRQQCAAKGFDAVEPDIGDSYTDNNGFGITEVQNAAYDNTLGTYAHSLGLAWGQKKGD